MLCNGCERGRKQIAHQAEALRQNLFGVARSSRAGNARRIGRAENRADRRAGDDAWFDAEFVEGFEHRDMSQAARAAAAKGQADGRRPVQPRVGF